VCGQSGSAADRALRELPHDQIAVQWDVAVEIGLLATGFGTEPADFDTIVAGLVDCLDQIPDDVPVGMHLCYGDYQHQHFVQPDSLALQVRLVNALAAAARRAPNWFSFTVPQGRSDDGYFAPLRELNTAPETELAFALVPYHPDDQPAGTTTKQARLIDTYLAQTPAGARDWGICTECGMGRVEREDVPHLLDLHREILDANR
jgi:methionine synthase II (cobalamin-independent)